MVSRAAFLAGLLARQMPDDIEEAFSACSAGLFPATHDDLDTDCPCPDWARPCKHAAAVYFLLAEAFDDDPFLILAWRGRPRDELVANLRALRGTAPSDAPDGVDDPWTAIEQAAAPPLDERVATFWHAGPALTTLRLAPTVPRTRRDPHVPDAQPRKGPRHRPGRGQDPGPAGP